MTTRRRKGSGTIRVTPEGTYRALFAFTPGNREDIDGSPFATYAEAEAALDGVLAMLRESGTMQGGIMLRRLADRVFDRREKDGYRSVDSDRNVWKTHVASTGLVNMPARTVTRGEVRSLLAALKNKKTGKTLATQTRRNVLNVLRAVFAGGVDDELVADNPCIGIKVKHHGSTLETSTFLTAAEAETLMRHAGPAVAIAIGTGMRSGELRSLLWADVHTDHLVVRFGKPGKASKSGKIRNVPILPFVREALDALPRVRPMVLPATMGGFRTKGRVVEPEDWKAWKTAAGLTRRVRFHDLRHTCATLLLMGAWGRPWSYEEVKEMLGHSSVKVTERYARATGTLAEIAVREMRKGEMGAAVVTALQAKASMIQQRCRWDLNPHMPVLQSGDVVRDVAWMDRLLLLARSYVEAVRAGDAHAHAKGLDLADHAWADVAAQNDASVAS